MSFELEKEILNATKYVSGYINEDDKYVLSASMIGKEPLENYLSIIYGKEPETILSDATLGTILHKGMETIMQSRMKDNKNILCTEYSMYMNLPNGWVISGTADLITEPTVYNYEVHDYKFTKNYTVKMYDKESTTHAYSKQLDVLNLLWSKGLLKEHGQKTTVVSVLDFFLKDSKAINKEPILVQRKREAPDKEKLLEELTNITNELQEYIESGTVPPKCEDLWSRKVNGKLIPTKCALYCSHGKAGNCPYYQPSDIMAVQSLANW